MVLFGKQLQQQLKHQKEDEVHHKTNLKRARDGKGIPDPDARGFVVVDYKNKNVNIKTVPNQLLPAPKVVAGKAPGPGSR